MTTYEELLDVTNKKFKNEIGPLLEKHDLLIHYDGFVDKNFMKILDRIELQKESITEKIAALSQHMDNTKTLDGFDKGLLRDLIFLMAQTPLGYFEILTKWLSYCIDLNKIKYGSRKPMYGAIMNQLGDFTSDGNLVFLKAGLRTFFNVELRNALGHDDWWLNENAEFTFKEGDGTEISLNIGEQHGDLAGINAIVDSFLRMYLTKFDPQSLVTIDSKFN